MLQNEYTSEPGAVLTCLWRAGRGYEYAHCGRGRVLSDVHEVMTMRRPKYSRRSFNISALAAVSVFAEAKALATASAQQKTLKIRHDTCRCQVQMPMTL